MWDQMEAVSFLVSPSQAEPINNQPCCYCTQGTTSLNEIKGSLIFLLCPLKKLLCPVQLTQTQAGLSQLFLFSFKGGILIGPSAIFWNIGHGSQS
jgi:hypothetical protein